MEDPVRNKEVLTEYNEAMAILRRKRRELIAHGVRTAEARQGKRMELYPTGDPERPSIPKEMYVQDREDKKPRLPRSMTVVENQKRHRNPRNAMDVESQQESGEDFVSYLKEMQSEAQTQIPFSEDEEQGRYDFEQANVVDEPVEDANVDDLNGWNRGIVYDEQEERFSTEHKALLEALHAATTEGINFGDWTWNLVLVRRVQKADINIGLLRSKVVIVIQTKSQAYWVNASVTGRVNVQGTNATISTIAPCSSIGDFDFGFGLVRKGDPLTEDIFPRQAMIVFNSNEKVMLSGGRGRGFKIEGRAYLVQNANERLVQNQLLYCVPSFMNEIVGCSLTRDANHFILELLCTETLQQQVHWYLALAVLPLPVPPSLKMLQ